MVDHSAMKLGKQAPRHDARTLKLGNYLTAQLAPAPKSCDWGAKATNLGEMMNDQIGDCAFAAAGHLVQCWTAENGRQVVVPDADIVAAYSAVTGYVPGDPSTDNGTVMLDKLNYWRKTGIGGHKLAAFASLDPANEEHVRQAIYLFGGVDIGLALPLSAQFQDVWSVAISGDLGDPSPGSWGGHDVCAVAYDEYGLTVITWGRLKRATWDFWRVYCDESYACLSQEDWADGVAGRSPSGFEFAALQADLSAVTG